MKIIFYLFNDLHKKINKIQKVNIFQVFFNFMFKHNIIYFILIYVDLK